MKLLVSGVVIVFGLALAPKAYAVDIDPALPPYKAKSLGDATIKSVGSDTLGELMRMWADDFTKLNPIALPVAVDALAVYVNKDKPIQCLTIEQLDQIFFENPFV